VTGFHRTETLGRDTAKSFHQAETLSHDTVKPFYHAEKSFFGAKTSFHRPAKAFQYTIKPDDFDDLWLERAIAQITDKPAGNTHQNSS
jgi:hypothetical protein